MQHLHPIPSGSRHTAEAHRLCSQAASVFAATRLPCPLPPAIVAPGCPPLHPSTDALAAAVGATLTQRRPPAAVEDGRRHAAALIAHKVTSTATTRQCARMLCPAVLFTLVHHQGERLSALCCLSELDITCPEVSHCHQPSAGASVATRDRQEPPMLRLATLV